MAAIEAACGPRGLVAHTGEAIRIVGYSPTAARVLIVVLLPHEHPPQGSGMLLPPDQQLRRLAETRGVEPSVLARQWVIDQLDAAEQARDQAEERWERDLRATTESPAPATRRAPRSVTGVAPPDAPIAQATPPTRHPTGPSIDVRWEAAYRIDPNASVADYARYDDKAVYKHAVAFNDTNQQRSRDQVLGQAMQETIDKAVAAGAVSGSVQVVEVEEVPLTYLPGNATRIRVKAVGDLDLEGVTDAAYR